MTIYDLIRKHIVNEKTNELEKLGKYTFKVNKVATKPMIKKAVEEVFNVTVTKVNVINSKATVRVFRGIKGKTDNEKKVVVTLANGQKINDLGGV